MKKKTIISLILAVLIIGAIFTYNYIYKAHRDISTETAQFSVTASDLISEFAADANKAQTKYLNKTIIITGNVTDNTATSITLNSSIFCSFLPDQKLPRASKNVYTVKGRCIGYDDLLEEIKLDQTTILP